MRWVAAAILLHLAIFSLPLFRFPGVIERRVTIVVTDTSVVNRDVSEQPGPNNKGVLWSVLEDQIASNVVSSPESIQIQRASIAPHVVERNTYSGSYSMRVCSGVVPRVDAAQVFATTPGPIMRKEWAIAKEHVPVPVSVGVGCVFSMHDVVRQTLVVQEKAVQDLILGGGQGKGVYDEQSFSAGASGIALPARFPRSVSSLRPCYASASTITIEAVDGKPSIPFSQPVSHQAEPARYPKEHLPAMVSALPEHYQHDPSRFVLKELVGALSVAGRMTIAVLPLHIAVDSGDELMSVSSAPVVVSPGQVPQRACAGKSPRLLLDSSTHPGVALSFDHAVYGLCGLPDADRYTRGCLEPATTLTEAYIALISRYIRNRKTYPEPARGKALEGSVVIRFKLMPEGYVESCTILQASPHDVINRAALELIHDAQPFPPFFAGIKQESITLQLEVVYDLEDPES